MMEIVCQLYLPDFYFVSDKACVSEMIKTLQNLCHLNKTWFGFTTNRLMDDWISLLCSSLRHIQPPVCSIRAQNIIRQF